MRGIIYRSVLVAVLILNSLVVSATNPSMKHDMGAMPMELGPGDADLDLRFIDAMILHHQGAIQMAKEALQKSKRPEIKQLSKRRKKKKKLLKWNGTHDAHDEDAEGIYDDG